MGTSIIPPDPPARARSRARRPRAALPRLPRRLTLRELAYGRTQGADLQYVQQLLGHSDIRTTTVYSHLVTAQQRETLAKYLEPPTGRTNHAT